MAVTILFVLGLPVFIFFKLWSRSELIHRPGLRPTEFFHFKLTWGWLFARYRPERWWWEAKVLIHKLLSSVIASALVDQPTRAVGALIGLQLVMLVIHVPMEPYPDEDNANVIDGMFLLIELVNAIIAYNAVAGGEISWFWDCVITTLNVVVLIPVVPDVIAMGGIIAKKIIAGQENLVTCQCFTHHRKEALALLFVTFAVSLNVLIISVGLEQVTEDFPGNAAIPTGEVCPVGWKNVTLVACKAPETDLSGETTGEAICQNMPWVMTGSQAFAPGDCVGRFTIQQNTDTTSMAYLSEDGVETSRETSCTACADGYAMVEVGDEDDEESKLQVCRSCAPVWMVVLSLFISIFVCAPVIAAMMNGFQLWMANHSGSDAGIDDASGEVANARDFLQLVRVLTMTVTHLQLTQLQLSLNIPWPAFLKLVVGMLTWPITFNFNFLTSAEAFCWSTLVAADMQVRAHLHYLFWLQSQQY